MAFADLSGRRIYYELHGEPLSSGSTPLVLIMGAAGSCAGWLPLQVPELSKSRSVLIFDHRGVGQSDDPGTPFSIAELAHDTVGLLDALDIEKADLLGPFMGGMTAQEMALTAPERVDRMVLVGTYARPDKKRMMLLEHWQSLLESDASLQALLAQRLLWTLHDDTLEQTDLIDAMMEYYNREVRPITPDLIRRQLQACVAHDTSDRLGALAHPALIICGRNDILTPPKFHRELADLIPESRLVTMSFGGHLVMVEAAERFNQIVTQFLDDGR